MVRVGRAALLASAAVLLGGCGLGKTERSGSVGDTLTANRLKVTLLKIDRHPPVPDSDVTGLSVPTAGNKLVGARVKVCSKHGGAIGSYSFELESSQGKARSKSPTATNYDERFDSVRTGCASGWLVYEIPREARPTKVRFHFEDTGSNNNQNNGDEVDARFTWKVE